MKSASTCIREAWRGEARLGELLLWCLPALLAGGMLRVLMEVRLPYGYIQFDSADFLLTPFKLLAEHHFVIDSKKAFLTPTFFTIPFLLHIPALLLIPIAQHLMGLFEVVIAGAIIRLWMPMWRWIVVPATVLIAISPWQIWYEHTLMGEANYVFFLFLIAWLGSLWVRRPTWGRFAWFAIALFCICGTRAEGKIMLLFGFAIIPLALWPRWKPMAIAVAAIFVAYELASLGAGGSHAFSLLYATLFDFTPNDIQSVPGIAPYLLPLRDQTIQDEKTTPKDLVKLAKDINDQVEKFVHEKMGVGKKSREPIAMVERQLCIEILKRRPLDVFVTPLQKFELASDGWASGADFGYHELREKQAKAVDRLHDEVNVIGIGMTGRQLDQAGMQQFVIDHYDPGRMAWFNQYEKTWSAASIALRLPDRPAPEPRWAHDFVSQIPHAERTIPGVPVYFILAWAGMIAAMGIRAPLRWTQAAFLLAMLFTWYTATMVGVTNARFRFAYDPVCYIYDVAAIAWAVWGVRCLILKNRKPISCTAS